MPTKVCLSFQKVLRPLSDRNTENIAVMAQLVYGSFIRVWREKEIAVKETRLKRLLLHDASHQGTIGFLLMLGWD